MVLTGYSGALNGFKPTKYGLEISTTEEVIREVNASMVKKDIYEHMPLTKKQWGEVNTFSDNFMKQIRQHKGSTLRLLKILSSTELKDLGEKSLTCLLFEKYKNDISGNDIVIVSNNKEDITAIATKIKKLQEYEGTKFNSDKHILGIHKFYHELYKKGLFNRHQLCYAIAVSNIDARIVNPELEGIFKTI
jgi:hypothetical protein